LDYLAIVRDLETQRSQYRLALHTFWTLDTREPSEVEEAYQTACRLLDELGPVKAEQIRR
jgi:hypothetical protein